MRRLGRVPLGGGHTYRFRFTRAMFSRLDYFHRACSARPPRRRDLAHVVVGVMG